MCICIVLIALLCWVFFEFLFLRSRRAVCNIFVVNILFVHLRSVLTEISLLSLLEFSFIGVSEAVCNSFFGVGEAVCNMFVVNFLFVQLRSVLTEISLLSRRSRLQYVRG
jgi:hypothetical protein